MDRQRSTMIAQGKLFYIVDMIVVICCDFAVIYYSRCICDLCVSSLYSALYSSLHNCYAIRSPKAYYDYTYGSTSINMDRGGFGHARNGTNFGVCVCVCVCVLKLILIMFLIFIETINYSPWMHSSCIFFFSAQFFPNPL